MHLNFLNCWKNTFGYVRIDCLSHEAFSGEYSISFQDNYTSQKSEVSLKDYLKYDDCLEKIISKEVLEKF